MPFLSYKCPACGHKFEELVSGGDAVPACPQCGRGQSMRAYEGKCNFGSLSHADPPRACAHASRCPAAGCPAMNG